MNDLIPYKEIVHLLNGCESNIFKLNENFWNRFDRNLFFNQLLEPQEVEQIKRIGSIALQYSHIQKFLDQPTDENDGEYRQLLHKGLNQMLSEFQLVLRDLEQNVNYCATLTAFSALQKYKLLLDDMVEFVNEIPQLSYIDVFGFIRKKSDSVHPIVSDAYKKCLKWYKLAFYEDLLYWCMHGWLNPIRNHFFICQSPNDRSIWLDKQNVPSFLSEESISRIHLSGKLIRFFEDNYGVTYTKIFEDKLDHLKRGHGTLCEANDFNDHDLSNFIKDVSSTVFRYAYFYLIKEANFLKYVDLIKSIHLMGNQAFWLSLIEDLLSIRSQRGAYGADFWNKQLLKAWKKNLGDFYVDEAYDEHIRTVQLDRITIHTLRDDQLIPADKINDGDVVMPTFSFTYHLPDIIKLVINDQLMEKYDIIFNFCFQLCQAKSVLCKCWKLSIRKKTPKRLDFIRFRLMIVLENIFYFYKVNVIERLFCKFLDDLQKYQDIFTMEHCHHSFVLNLMKESLLNIERVKDTFQGLFCFCFKLYQTFQRDNEVNAHEEDELEKQITDLYMKLYYLLANIRSYELSPSLSQLLFQIGKILMLNDQKCKIAS